MKLSEKIKSETLKVSNEIYKFSFNQFDYKDLEEKIKLIISSKNLEEVGVENKKYINMYLDKKILLEKFENLINE